MNKQNTGPTRHILGLDFGTSNTHLSISSAAEAYPIVDDVKIESDTSIPSIILYEERTFDVLGFGQRALEEWYSMSRSEKKRYNLGTGFKQRLAFNKRAETETELFLNALFSNLNDQRIVDAKNLSSNTELTCGIPSKTVQGHNEIMTQTLKKITGRLPVLIEEPLGALFFHIARKDISKDDANSGVLVVDFGGGTLDLAYIKNFKIQKIWGSPILGGIMFDDLFYNIFLEQNPGVQKKIIAEGISGYLRAVLFKNLKEKYSRLLSSSNKPHFNENIIFGKESLGTFEIANFEYLSEKMSNYKMSKELHQDIIASQAVETISEEDARINLPEQLRYQILKGNREYGIKSDGVSLIILTGGSSRWKFFLEMIEKEFPYTRVLASSDPESTISRGLGLCYSARLYEKKVRFELSGNKNDLIKRLKNSYVKTFNLAVDDYCELVFGTYARVISQVITSFYKKGGSLQELELNIKRAMEECSPEINKITDGFLMKINHEIEKNTKSELSRWFNRSLINYDFMGESSIGSEKIINTTKELKTLNDEIYNRISLISSLILGLIGGSLLGGSGIALLASGPLGWVGGFIGGVALSIASALGLKRRMSEWTKKMKIPKWLLKTLFISDKLIINKAQKSLRKSMNTIKAQMSQDFVALLKENEKKLEMLIEEQIQQISYSNVLDF